MFSFKKSILALAGLLLPFSVFCGFAALAQEKPAAGGAQTSVTAEGLVTPEKQIDLAAPSEGLLMEVLVKEGSFVSKGDPIVRLTNEEEQITLRQAELQSRQLAEDIQSTKRLYEEKAASRDDLTRAILASQRADAERDLLKIRLANRTITAPMPGYVLRLYKNPGESVQRMEKVAELVCLERKTVVVYLDSSFFGKIKAGTKATLIADSKAALEGEVEVADPVLDAGGRSFRIKILAADSQNSLVVGTRISVKLALP